MAKVIKIGLDSAGGRIPWLIEFFSRGKYSHAKCVLSDGLRVVEALSEGVVCSNRVQADMWLSLGVSDEEAQLWDSFLIAQVGKPYDYPMVAKFISVVRWAGKVNPVEEQESRQSEQMWFCSELASAAMEKIGHPLFLSTQPWEVPPHWIPRSLVWR